MTAYARACVGRLYAPVYSTKLIVQSKVVTAVAAAAAATTSAGYTLGQRGETTVVRRRNG